MSEAKTATRPRAPGIDKIPLVLLPLIALVALPLIPSLPTWVTLTVAGLLHQVADLSAGRARNAFVVQFLEPQGGHIHVNVDAIQQRAGYASEVALYFALGAAARPPGMGTKTAGTGIHGDYEHEPARKGYGIIGATDVDHAVLQGLTQYLQGGTVEFR